MGRDFLVTSEEVAAAANLRTAAPTDKWGFPRQARPVRLRTSKSSPCPSYPHCIRRD